MFRLTKLYLVILVLVATALGVVAWLGHRPYDEAVREGLVSEVTVRRQLFVQIERASAYDRIIAARNVASDPAVISALSRVSGAAGARPQDPNREDPSGIDALGEVVELAASTLRSRGLFGTDMVAVIGAAGRPLASHGADLGLDSRLPDLEGIEQALRHGISQDGVEVVGDALVLTATAPIIDRYRAVIGAVVVAERVDGRTVRDWAHALGADVVLFRDGDMLAASLTEETDREHVQNLLISIVANSGGTLAGESGADGGGPPQVRIEAVAGRLVATAPGRLRTPAPSHTGPSLGFMVVQGREQPPGNLALLLWEAGEIRPRSRDLWMTVAVGFVVLLLGLVLLQAESRRAAKRLATQLRSVTRSGTYRTTWTPRSVRAVGDQRANREAPAARFDAGDSDVAGIAEEPPSDVTMRALPSVVLGSRRDAADRVEQAGDLALSTAMEGTSGPGSAVGDAIELDDDLSIAEDAEIELVDASELFPSSDLEAIGEEAILESGDLEAVTSEELEAVDWADDEAFHPASRRVGRPELRRGEPSPTTPFMPAPSSDYERVRGQDSDTYVSATELHMPALAATHLERRRESDATGRDFGLPVDEPRDVEELGRSFELPLPGGDETDETFEDIPEQRFGGVDREPQRALDAGEPHSDASTGQWLPPGQPGPTIPPPPQRSSSQRFKTMQIHSFKALTEAEDGDDLMAAIRAFEESRFAEPTGVKHRVPHRAGSTAPGGDELHVEQVQELLIDEAELERAESSGVEALPESDDSSTAASRARYAPPPDWKPVGVYRTTPRMPRVDFGSSPARSHGRPGGERGQSKLVGAEWLGAAARTPTKPRAPAPMPPPAKRPQDEEETARFEDQPSFAAEPEPARRSVDEEGGDRGAAPRSDRLKTALSALKALEAKKAQPSRTQNGDPDVSFQTRLPTMPDLPPLKTTPTPPEPASAPQRAEPGAFSGAKTDARQQAVPPVDHRALFEQFIETRRRCGESTESLSFERFKKKIEMNEAAVKKRFGCQSVRLEVYVKNGRAAIKAIPR